MVLVGVFYFQKTPPVYGGFSPEVIASSHRPNPKWSVPVPTPEEEKKLHAILSQKFTFLGDGKQAFCFESEDKKYVVKFFKMVLLVPTWRDQIFPRFALKKLRKLNLLFNGYKGGYLDLRNETGMVWVHLSKTTGFNQTITVVDQDGKEYQIDADSTEFVIQEKAELFFTHLNRLYDEGKRAKVQQAIDDFFALIQYRADLGYMDRDKIVDYNYGFVGDRPVQVDLGYLYKRRNRKVHHKGQNIDPFYQKVDQWKSEHPL